MGCTDKKGDRDVDADNNKPAMVKFVISISKYEK